MKSTKSRNLGSLWDGVLLQWSLQIREGLGSRWSTDPLSETSSTFCLDCRGLDLVAYLIPS